MVFKPHTVLLLGLTSSYTHGAGADDRKYFQGHTASSGRTRDATTSSGGQHGAHSLGLDRELSPQASPANTTLFSLNLVIYRAESLGDI